VSLSTRELYLALRVRDEGTRNLQRFAQELVRTGTAARIAALKARADAVREEAALKRTEIAVKRLEVARLREAGASKAVLAGRQSAIAALQSEATALERQAQDYDRQATLITRNTQRFSHFTNTLTQTGVALETIGVAFGFVGVAGFATMNNLIDSAVEYERQVRLTATQIDHFDGNLRQIADVGKDIARNFAIPFMSVQSALFDIFSSMEVDVMGAELLLEAFAKAAVAGQTDIQAASRATIGIMNAFTIPVEEVNRVLDLQFQLVQEGIGSYEEWTARIGSVSPSAVRASQSLEQMLAALAASTRFGIPAAQSATAVARAFDAFSNPTAVERMEELGIEIRNADGSLRPFNEVIRQFRDVLRDIPEAERVETILDVFRGAGSTIQARKFLQTLLLTESGLETLDLMLSEMTGDTGAFENAYAMMADTTAMRSQILANKFAIVKESIGEALLPAFNRLLSTIERGLDWFDRLPQSVKDTIAQFLLWGSILAVVFGVILTGIGLMAVFIASLAATWSVMAPMVAIVGALVAAITFLVTSFAVAWQVSSTFRQIVKDLWEDVKSLGSIVLNTGRDIAKAFKEHLLPPLKNLAKLFEEKVLPAFNEFRNEVWDRMKPKIEEAGRILVSIAKEGFQFIGDIINNIIIPAIRALTEWWGRNKESMMPVIEFLIQFGKWAAIVAAVITGVLAMAFIGPLVLGIMAVVAAFVLLVEIVQGVIWVFGKIWEGIQFLYNQARDFYGWIREQFTGAMTAITVFFTVDVPAFFRGVPGWLYDVGEDFIGGFIQGMKSKFTNALAEISDFGENAVGMLKDVLEIGSPSRRMMVLGSQSAEGYILGYKRTMADAMFGNDSFLGLRPQAMVPVDQGRVGGVEDARSALTDTNPTKVIHNNITVNTQELDARAQAEMLGWELAGRM
jgi:TP901 family phage tail tape measure protein